MYLPIALDIEVLQASGLGMLVHIINSFKGSYIQWHILREALDLKGTFYAVFFMSKKKMPLCTIG